jgi:flagellar hook-basal body complex protein FliE
MTILPNLPSLGAIPSLPQLGAEAGNAADGTTGGFGDTLRGAIQGVQQMEGQAQQQVTGLLSGNGQDVHSATLAVEQANLSFELMLQVRNKVVSAYQEISRLQF